MLLVMFRWAVRIFLKLINKLDSQKSKDYKFSFEHIEEWIENHW